MSTSDVLEDLELQEVERRCNAATPGPWKAFVEGRDHESGSSFIQTAATDIELTGATIPDYDFIANARQDIPRLLRTIACLQRRLETSTAVSNVKNT